MCPRVLQSHQGSNFSIADELTDICLSVEDIAKKLPRMCERVTTDPCRRQNCKVHMLRMEEDRLVRKEHLKCVKPEKESMFGDIPNPNVEKAIETTRDREKWTKLRPSRRGYPLYGDVE